MNPKNQKPQMTKNIAKELWELKESILDYLLNPQKDNLKEHIKSSLTLHKQLMKTDLIKMSMNQQEASWTYDNHFGLFINKEGSTRIAIVLPYNGHSKYIHAETKTGKEILAALPYPNHAEIALFIQNIIGERLGKVLGGRIETTRKPFSNPTLTLYETSQTYGKPDYEEVSRILNSAGLETKIRD